MNNDKKSQREIQIIKKLVNLFDEQDRCLLSQSYHSCCHSRTTSIVTIVPVAMVRL